MTRSHRGNRDRKRTREPQGTYRVSWWNCDAEEWEPEAEGLSLMATRRVIRMLEGCWDYSMTIQIANETAHPMTAEARAAIAASYDEEEYEPTGQQSFVFEEQQP